MLFGKTGAARYRFQLARDVPEREVVRRSAVAAAWIVGFFAAIVLFGFPVAVPPFCLPVSQAAGERGWIFSAVFTAAVWAFFYGLFDRLLHLPFPAGWALTWIS